MIDSISLQICSIFGLCKKSKFPGTLASLASLIFSILVYYFLGKTFYVFLFLFFLIIGFWAIGQIQKKNGKKDHQWIGVDEWIGIWLANFFLFEFNFSLVQIIFFSSISFLIFRIIDIFKFIPPLQNINKNQNQNATAVMLDDIIGGFYTYFLMLIILGFYNLNYLYYSFFLLLPGMVANATPVFLKIKYFNIPINEQIFGKNKTWRGFIGAIIFGSFSYFILVKLNLVNGANSFSLIILVGFLFGLGAIGGDLIKSFFKRIISIKPGESWTPFDQIDYILGMIILTYFFYHYTFSQIIFLLILGGTISALAHRLGFLIKINTSKQ